MLVPPNPPPRPPYRARPATDSKIETEDRFCPTQAALAVDLQAAQERAQKRFGKIPGVRIEVIAPAASAFKPVVVLRQAQGDVQGCRVHLHFHGDQFDDANVDYDGRIGPTVQRAWGKDGNLVFVIPEAGNENAGPRTDWNHISDLGLLVNEALSGAGVDPAQTGPRILSGHSAGGSPVAKAIARGEAGQFQRIELYDAAVGSTLNPVSDGDRAKVRQWVSEHQEQFLYVPGIMTGSAWKTYIDPSRWTAPAADHWSPLWDSLGQRREPG